MSTYMASTKIAPRDVVDALETLTPEQTKELFYHLGVGLHVMSSIESQQKGNMQKIHIVQVWFDKGFEVSWNSIVAALKKIGMNALAGSVASQHNLEGGDNLTSDPVNPPVPVSVTNSPVISDSAPSDPAQPLIPVATSSDHPATVANESASSDPLQPLTPLISTAHPTTGNTDPAQQVREEIEQLQDSFTSIMSQTRSALCKKELENTKFIDDLRDFLIFLPLSKKAPHSKFFRESEDDILEAKATPKLLAILGRYCDYSNYDLLLHLIKKFCDTAEKNRMQDYCQSLERFEMATPVNVYLVAISASPAISEAFSRMALKMNKPVSECTLHEIRKLKESLTEKAFLHSYSVYIDTIAESSVLVVLRFPPNCIGWVLAAVTPDFMDTHHLTEVSVDGKYLTKSQENEELITSEEATPHAEHSLHSQISADEEYARQLQFEFDAMSYIQNRGEGVTVPLHGDLQSTLTDEECAHQLQFEFNREERNRSRDVTQTTAFPRPFSQPTDEEYARQLQQREVDTPPQDEKLWRASEDGDVVRVASLLNSGADIETRSGGYSDTPLGVASQKGHLHIVRLLLQRGAMIETRDKFGFTPLATAVSFSKRDVVIELLDNGADANAQTDGGYSVLMEAARERGTEVVMKVIKAGANLNMQNEDGDSALIAAAMWGNTEVVVELVKSGADLNLQNENGDSAVITATVEHESGALKELVNAGADLNLQNQEGLTALMISARNEKTELTDILLTGENIDPDIQENNTGWSALFFSAERGDVTTTKSLLKAGANACLKDKNGLTALDVAAANTKGDSEAVCELLRMYMEESAPLETHHGTVETATQTTEQESSSSDHGSTQDGANRQRGLSEALRKLVNISGQRVLQIFNQLERRLKSADKSRQLSEGRDGGQSKQKRKKKRKPSTRHK